MRISTFAVLTFASCIVAKNVFYLDNLRAALDGETENTKRDARNVASLQDLKDAIESEQHHDKRDQDVVEMNPLLQNLLPQVPSLSIFSGYLRDDLLLNKQMEAEDSFTLLLAPSDEAISKYSLDTGLKPWQYPKDADSDDNDEAVNYNIDYFLRAHISTEVTAFDEKNGLTTKLLDGKAVSIVRDAQTDTYGLTVNDVAVGVASVRLADNGIVFVIDAVLAL